MLTRENIIELYAKKIRALMEQALVYCLQEVRYGIKCNDSDEEKYKLLQELAQLTSEFLLDKEIEKKILELANESSVNGEDNETKLKIFKVLRNIISHFPIFETYDDIILSKSILTWNSPQKTTILDFFNDNDGKDITSRIYYKNNDDIYEEIKQVTVKIRKFEDGEERKLCDIISLNDAIWMFSIVDYYLDYLGLKINPQYGLSI